MRERTNERKREYERVRKEERSECREKERKRLKRRKMLRCTIRRELPSMFPVTRKKKKKKKKKKKRKHTQRTRRYTETSYTERDTVQKIYLYIDYNLAEIRLKQKKKKNVRLTRYIIIRISINYRKSYDYRGLCFEVVDDDE